MIVFGKKEFTKRSFSNHMKKGKGRAVVLFI